MPLRQLWGGYLRQLERRPIVVKALSSATTFSLTDILAQGRERHIAAPGEAATYDPVRTVRNGLFGLLWLGPTNHVFWGRSVLGLEHWFPGSAWRMVLSRVAVDQMTAMPANMLVFLAWQPLLSGEGVGEAYRRVREGWMPSVSMALCVWPFIHPFNFRFVPIQHRLLVLNVCSLGVFSYATFVSEKKADAVAAAVLFDAGESPLLEGGSTHPAMHYASSGGEQGAAASVAAGGELGLEAGGGELSAGELLLEDELQRLDGRLEVIQSTLGCGCNNDDDDGPSSAHSHQHDSS